MTLTIYAVGDIHGQRHLLRKIHKAIRQDADRHGVQEAEVVYLGDYINRGKDSKGVVDDLLARRLPWPAVHLRGNHEAMLLNRLSDPGLADTMMAVGGFDTLRSYGLDPKDYGGSTAAAEALWHAMPEAHRNFYAGTPLLHRRDDWLFCHAGISPFLPLDQQKEETLLWVREPFLSYDGWFPEGVRVVHGHTIRPKVEIRINRIGIDTGAYKHGRLSAVALRGNTIRILTAQ